MNRAQRITQHRDFKPEEPTVERPIHLLPADSVFSHLAEGLQASTPAQQDKSNFISHLLD